MPSTNRRWRTRNRISVGSSASSAAAIIAGSPLAPRLLACIAASPTGSVRCASSLATSSGHRWLSQLAMKMNSASAAIGDSTIGTTMLRRIRSSPAPSMRAASSSSSGTASMLWRIRKMPNALVPDGTISPKKLLTQPRS
jgi:hypothetical protein